MGTGRYGESRGREAVLHFRAEKSPLFINMHTDHDCLINTGTGSDNTDDGLVSVRKAVEGVRDLVTIEELLDSFGACTVREFLGDQLANLVGLRLIYGIQVDRTSFATRDPRQQRDRHC